MVCARWVPRLLKEEQRQSCRYLCAMNLIMHEELGDNFWRQIITADETILPHFIPETQTSVHAVGSPRRQRAVGSPRRRHEAGSPRREHATGSPR